MKGLRGRAIRLALLLGAPTAVLLAGEAVSRSVATRSAEAVRADLASDADEVARAFRSIADGAAAVARIAAERSPAAAAEEAASLFAASRLEGVGVLGPDGEYVEWIGRPEEPPALGDPARKGALRLEVQGLTTRLVALNAAHDDGRQGSATVVLDGTRARLAFRELLPARIAEGTLRGVEFLDSDEPRKEMAEILGATDELYRAGPPPSLYRALRAAGGEILAVATLQERPVANLVAGHRARYRAVAAVLLAALAALLVDWRSLCRSTPGVVASLASLAAGRYLLAATRAPVHLLPREVGSASVFGSPAGWGVLASPADLLLTCLALFLGARAVRSRLRETGGGRATAAAAAAATALGAAAVAGLSSTLARDARVAVLELGSLGSSAGQVCLVLGFAFPIVATAELAAEVWAASAPRTGSRRLAAALAMLPVAALAVFNLLHVEGRIARERLRFEFAPQVLEQGARRRVSLQAAVRGAALSERVLATVASPRGPQDEFAAYLAWVESDLFHAGFVSSLDLYDAGGARRSHFAFNMSPLLEEAPAAAAGGPRVLMRNEKSRVGEADEWLVHAETPIVDAQGATAGTVVGHVLDQPDNLPFLPGSSALLAALGPAPVGRRPEGSAFVPDYVLYDRDGSVVLSTLRSPPGAGGEIARAARTAEMIDVRVGGERYLTLPLAAEDRLHVLMLRRSGRLEQLGTFVRLALIALALLALLEGVPLAFRRGGIGRLLGAVRASFYRKLLVTLLAASLVPLVGLALLVRGAIQRRADVTLVESATQIARVVRQVVEDYAAVQASAPGVAPHPLNDEVLHWLRRVVGQDIHLYQDGLLLASSRRELFASGFLSPRLPGEIQERLVREGLPYLVRPTELGSSAFPIAYARARLPGAAARATVVAVPVILQQREVAGSAGRIVETLLLATVALGGLLAAAAALLARTVAKPVRDLLQATARIAGGDYDTRLAPRTRDEFAGLVDGFRAMAAALAHQRADLERRRDYMEALLRNATTGVISTDPSGRIVTLNPAAEALLSREGGGPRVGDDLAAFTAGRTGLAPLARALGESPAAAGEPLEVDLGSGGDVQRLRLVRVPLPDPGGGPSGRLHLLDDVTSLMRSNELAAWAEMARAIAHEIKNPLTPIQLSAEHLLRLLGDRPGGIQPEAEECIGTVIKQVRALREIAAEFSAYSRLPALSPVPTDPAALVRDAAAPYLAAHPPGIAIVERHDAAPRVLADRRVLSRAIVNLIENAIQAMRAGGTLTLATGPAASGGVVLSVKDTGPGLDPEARLHLFEPYFSTKTSGTGLGLAIVRRAVEAHGGQIEVESGAGGTAFRIRLPEAP